MAAGFGNCISGAPPCCLHCKILSAEQRPERKSQNLRRGGKIPDRPRHSFPGGRELCDVA